MDGYWLEREDLIRMLYQVASDYEGSCADERDEETACRNCETCEAAQAVRQAAEELAELPESKQR